MIIDVHDCSSSINNCIDWLLGLGRKRLTLVLSKYFRLPSTSYSYILTYPRKKKNMGNTLKKV